MRDTTKLIALGRGNTVFSKAQIQIYSPAGESILLLSVVISISTDFVYSTKEHFIVGFCKDCSFWMDVR